MTKPKTYRLGDLQLKIMKVLWSRPEATVTEVQEAVSGGDDLAYTTMATMLRKMEERGLVAHRNEGRSYVYRARANADEVTRSMADHLVDRLFEGSLAGAVNHLLSTREVSREELAQLERLIAERKRKSL